MKKKLQFLWLLISAFIRRHKKFIAFGSLGGFLFTILFLQIYPALSRLPDAQSPKIGIIGRYTEDTLPQTLQKQISLGLTGILPSGEATGSLAKSWDVDESSKVYTFHLRPNIPWHDGKQFTAKDINYRIKDAKITIPEDFTYRITLSEPYSPLPTVLSSPLIKPGLIGLGPYKVTRLQYSGDFLSEILLKPVLAGQSDILYRFYPTADDAILAYKLGEINSLQNVTDVADLSTWKNTKIAKYSQYDSYVGLFFNLKDSLFRDKEVRQALTYAVPPFEGYTKAYTPISPLSWAYSSKVRLYRFDPETARKILSKSELATSSSELTITTFASFVKTAQSVADAWNRVGVNAKIKVVNTVPTDYRIFLAAQLIPPDPDQYMFWQSTQTATNLSHYNNQKIDKLLEDGRKESDREKRIKIYADFQRYLVDDAPVIFLYYPNTYTVERK